MMENQPMAEAIETPEAQAETIEFQARAALANMVDHIPRDWINGVVAMQTMTRPKAFSRPRWDQLCHDAFQFLLECADRATALGWTTAEIFGCDGADLLNRGLVARLHGGKVVVLSADSATVLSEQGQRLEIQRCLHPEETQVALWDLEDARNNA